MAILRVADTLILAVSDPFRKVLNSVLLLVGFVINYHHVFLTVQLYCKVAGF